VPHKVPSTIHGVMVYSGSDSCRALDREPQLRIVRHLQLSVSHGGRSWRPTKAIREVRKGGNQMDAALTMVVDDIGAMHNWRPLSADTMKRYARAVPKRLSSIWRDHGVGGFGAGRFWLVDPLLFQAPLDQWLEGTPFHGADKFTTFGRTAFGDLISWGESTGILTISPLFGHVHLQDNLSEISNGKSDRIIDSFLATLEKDETDISDEGGRALFDRVSRKLGPIAESQVYGLVPAPALGGRVLLKNVKKMEVLPYLSLLADITPRDILQNPLA
jgi:hypothetical protein